MRVLKSFLLAILAFTLVCNVVLAAWGYLFPINIVDTSNTTRAYYPVMLGFGGQTLVDAEKILASGNDTNMQIGSQSIKYMMSTTNVTAVLPSLPSGGVVTTSLYTGYSPSQSGFPIITGSGGYVTVADNTSLELSNNFSISRSGYFDAGTSGNLTMKTRSIGITGDGSGGITLYIVDDSTNTILNTDSTGNETNLILVGAATNWQAVQADDGDVSYVHDRNIGAYAYDSYGLNLTVTTDQVYTVDSVEVWVTLKTNGMANFATPGLRLSGVNQMGSEITTSALAYTSYNQTVAKPGVGSWSFSDLADLQVRLGLKDNGAGGWIRCTSVNVTVYYTPQLQITTSSVSSAEHTIEALADTTNLTLKIDGATVNTTSLGGFSVSDNTSDWVFESAIMPYCDNITLSVNGTRQLYLAPLVMLTGVTIPDRAGGNNPGTIHWGSNSGITITYGEMSSYESYVATSNETAGFDVPIAPMPDTWFAGGENVANLPFYDSFLEVSSQEGMPPVQAFYFWGIIGVAFGAFLGIVTFTHSALMAYIAMVIVFGVGASMTIIPAWIVFAMIIVGAGIMFLYRQVA